MMMKSKTFYFPKGTIIADGRDAANGMMVITQGHVSVELPMDSDEADHETGKENGSTLLYTLGRGFVLEFVLQHLSDFDPLFIIRHQRLGSVAFRLRPWQNIYHALCNVFNELYRVDAHKSFLSSSGKT